MSALLLSILSVFAQADAPRAEETKPSGAAEKAELRKFYDIAQDVRNLIREDARARTKSEKAASIHNLTDLFLEIKRDPRLAGSDTLKSYKAKLWVRLTAIKKKLIREFDLPNRPTSPAAKPTRVAASGTKPSPVDELANEISLSLSDQLGLVGGSLGGPGQAYSAGGDDASARGGDGRFDYGPSLVSLIERTIHPDFWDVNGGPGSIVYYRPLHALVVTATSEIHHSLGGTLDALRKTMF